jgi:hypothetical protein
MASPLRTWVSVFIVLSICWYVFFNVLQIQKASYTLSHPMASKSLETRNLQYHEMNPGMIGQGLLILFVILGVIFVTTHHHERPDLHKSQKLSFGVICVLLILTVVIHLLMHFLNDNRMMDPKNVLIISLSMDALRLLFLGGMIGCSVHLMQRH